MAGRRELRYVAGSRPSNYDSILKYVIVPLPGPLPRRPDERLRKGLEQPEKEARAGFDGRDVKLLEVRMGSLPLDAEAVQGRDDGRGEIGVAATA